MVSDIVSPRASHKASPRLQLWQVIATTPAPYRLILTMMLETGLSSTEILALNQDDIRVAQNVFQIRLHHGLARQIVTIVLHQAPQSMVGLRQHIDSSPAHAPETPLFCSQQGRRCSYDALHHQWVRACRSAGLIDVQGRPLIALHQITQGAAAPPARVIPVTGSFTGSDTRSPAASAASIPLTTTKLHPPALRAQHIRRQRLLTQLDQALEHRLLLVSAPAGAGKTMLLSEWNQQLVLPVAWIALDDTDNDPVRFWAYLSAALTALLPYPLVAGSQPHADEAATTLLPTLLINALAQVTTPIVLMLDDYHRITTMAIHQSMDWFIERMPTCMHLVIASRHDPPLALARLRVRNELVEVRMPDLACTEAESQSFLRRVMGLDLDQMNMRQLWTQSEGWLAGLQLAALAARGSAGSQMPQPKVVGSQRLLADYLGDEVLRQLPAPTQAFLLQTAHLDRFCASLCDAVLVQAEDSVADSQTMLLALERANLFLIPLDQERRWYRYHHLFADMLRQHPQQQAQTTRTIHQRAAHWYAEASFIDEAIDHALLARDYPYAVTLIAQIAEARVWQRGDVLTLLGWLQPMPDSILQSQPGIRRAQAWALVATRQFATLDQLLTRLEATTEASPVLGALELARLRVAAATMRGDPAGALALIAAIQPQLSHAAADEQAALAIEQGMALRTLGDAAGAQVAFSTAVRISQQTSNPMRTLIADSHLGAVQTWQGQLHAALASFQHALRCAEASGIPDMPVTGMVAVWLGRVLYEWGDLTSAEATIRRGLDHGAQWWSRDIQMAGMGTLALVLAARRDLQGLTTLYDDAQLLALRYNLHWPAAVVSMFLVQVYADTGDLSAALAQAETMRSIPWQASDGFGRVGEVAILTRIRLLLAQHEYQQALSMLAQAPAQVPGGGSYGLGIELALLTVQAQLQAADLQAAGQALDQALMLAEPEGYIQLFLNAHATIRDLLIQRQRQRRPTDPVRRFAERMLRMFPQRAGLPEALPAAPLIEPLRARERDILILLAAGHSTKAIADQLILSPGTVKWHLQHIYTKLQVGSRTQAVARARELGLLR